MGQCAPPLPGMPGSCTCTWSSTAEPPCHSIVHGAVLKDTHLSRDPRHQYVYFRKPTVTSCGFTAGYPLCTRKPRYALWMVQQPPFICEISQKAAGKWEGVNFKTRYPLPRILKIAQKWKVEKQNLPFWVKFLFKFQKGRRQRRRQSS